MAKRICQNCVYYCPEPDIVDVKNRTIMEIPGECRRRRLPISKTIDCWCGDGLFKEQVNDSIALVDITGNRRGFYFPE